MSTNGDIESIDSEEFRMHAHDYRNAYREQAQSGYDKLVAIANAQIVRIVASELAKQNCKRLRVENEITATVDRMLVTALSPRKYGAAGAYHNGSPEQRAKIDAAIAQADGVMTTARESRDRRKASMPYDAEGFDRRKADRRNKPRHED